MPLLGFAIAVPLFTVHPDCVDVVVTLNVLLDVTETVCVCVHPFESVIVAVYVPMESPVAVWVVCPLFQL